MESKTEDTCSKCGLPYGFVRARVTMRGGINVCLSCGAEMLEHGLKK